MAPAAPPWSRHGHEQHGRGRRLARRPARPGGQAHRQEQRVEPALLEVALGARLAISASAARRRPCVRVPPDRSAARRRCHSPPTAAALHGVGGAPDRSSVPTLRSRKYSRLLRRDMSTSWRIHLAGGIHARAALVVGGVASMPTAATAGSPTCAWASGSRGYTHRGSPALCGAEDEALRHARASSPNTCRNANPKPKRARGEPLTATIGAAPAGPPVAETASKSARSCQAPPASCNNEPDDHHTPLAGAARRDGGHRGRSFLRLDRR